MIRCRAGAGYIFDEVGLGQVPNVVDSCHCAGVGQVPEEVKCANFMEP